MDVFIIFCHFFVLTSLFVQHNDGTHPHFGALNKNIIIQNFVQLHYLTFFMLLLSNCLKKTTFNFFILYCFHKLPFHYHLNFFNINNMKSIKKTNIYRKSQSYFRFFPAIIKLFKNDLLWHKKPKLLHISFQTVLILIQKVDYYFLVLC